MTTHEHPVCGRCGVYRHLHPHKRCAKSRRSYWWDEHLLRRHVAGGIWLNLPEKWRWAVVSWWHERNPRLCWCDLVDAAYLDVKKDDYRDDLCDVPLPTDAGLPRLGSCYCDPPRSETAA